MASRERGRVLIAEDKTRLVQLYLPSTWRVPGMDVTVVENVADLEAEVARRGDGLDVIVCGGTLEEHHDGVRAMEQMETDVRRYLWTGDTFLNHVRRRMADVGAGWLDKLELPTVIPLAFGAMLSRGSEVLVISPGGSWNDHGALLQARYEGVIVLGPGSHAAAHQAMVETDRFGLVLDFTTIGQDMEFVPPSVKALQAIAAGEGDGFTPRVVALPVSTSGRIDMFRAQLPSS